MVRRVPARGPRSRVLRRARGCQPNAPEIAATASRRSKSSQLPFRLVFGSISEPVRVVVGEEVVCPSGRWPGWREWPDDAVAVAEADAAVGVALDGVAAFVDEAMVLPAEEDEVVEARLAAVRPVLAVVRLQMAAALAAGETAGVVVARLEQPAQRGRDGAAAAADTHAGGRRVRSAPRSRRRSRAGGRSRARSAGRPRARSGRAHRWRARRRRRGRRRAPARRGARPLRPAMPRRGRAAPRRGQGAEDRRTSGAAPASRLRARSPPRRAPRGDARARAHAPPPAL